MRMDITRIKQPIEFHASCRWCGRIQPLDGDLRFRPHAIGKHTVLSCIGQLQSPSWFFEDFRERGTGESAVIAGTREIHDFRLVTYVINSSKLNIRKVISGKARGVDTLGELWATERSIPIDDFPAKWNKSGRMAGIVRNTEMAKVATALIAVWDGRSKGTDDMIKKATSAGLHVFVGKVLK